MSSKLIHGLIVGSAALASCLFADSVAGDVAWLKNSQQSQPMSGLILSVSTDFVEFLEFNAGRDLNKIAIPKSELVRLVKTIDPQSLKALSPSSPEGYRDSAEILSSYPSDAYAQYLAKRLYFLGAYWGRGEIRLSCFRGMISLCDDEALERRIRAVAFQNDPDRDPAWLDEPVSPSTKISNGISVETTAIALRLRADQLMLLSKIRNRAYLDAFQLLESIERQADRVIELGAKELVQEFETIRPILKQVVAEQQVSPEQWVFLMSLEIALLSERPLGQRWNSLMIRDQPDFRSLTIESIAEFPPERCFFLNGEWLSEQPGPR